MHRQKRAHLALEDVRGNILGGLIPVCKINNNYNYIKSYFRMNWQPKRGNCMRRLFVSLAIFLVSFNYSVYSSPLLSSSSSLLLVLLTILSENTQRVLLAAKKFNPENAAIAKLCEMASTKSAPNNEYLYLFFTPSFFDFK